LVYLSLAGLPVVAVALLVIAGAPSMLAPLVLVISGYAWLALGIQIATNAGRDSGKRDGVSIKEAFESDHWKGTPQVLLVPGLVGSSPFLTIAGLIWLAVTNFLVALVATAGIAVVFSLHMAWRRRHPFDPTSAP
jgi:hypothetical protein